ncbi:ABC transporter permease [Ferrovibrio sp.]|uniref:ABC transporter permease n=1 Tax=Ferrovibrio sp. TaxID=1917215 RepID=UPI003D0A6C2A
MKKLKGRFISALSLIVFLLFWHYGTVLFGVPAYLLPGPYAVLQSAIKLYSTGLIFPHIGITVTEMMVGYACGCLVAFLLASLVAEFEIVEQIVVPYVIGFQSMPKVALAPILLVWFGFGLASKVILVALICFFPVFVNTLSGLRATNSDLLDLYKAFSAPRWLVYWDVKLPGAANSIFAGLQIAIVLGLIGAVVGEFVAAKQGLGYLIQASSMNFDVGTMFTSVFTLSMIGIIGHIIIRAIQSRVIYWDGNRQAGRALQPPVENA